MAVDPTPVRALGVQRPDGCLLLRDVGLSYRDGGENEVLRLIAQATDLTSTGDELIRGAKDWAQTYHLHPSRSNVVRCLDLPGSARVLEIGAGCGAITRYLGETCASVDALEPVPVRATAARARTRDLDTVEVFVGELSDVPAEPTYDVIVVIGVLEYVGRGGADRAPYLEFLREIRHRLVAGGTLVLAIENQLGVKYLSGAPEDHSSRVFDSLEGYPAGSPARTFSRRQLGELLADAGLDPTFRVAFPDYKMTRAVLGEFPAEVRSLLHRIPQFPSPDWAAVRPPLADERSFWRTLVEAGLEMETGNSFVVLAGNGAPSRLWPADAAAVFYSTGRRARLAAQTVVRVEGESVRFDRQPLVPRATRPADRFVIAASDHAYEAGEDLLDHIAMRPDADLVELLTQWQGKIDERLSGDDAGTLDVVPHNLVVDEDGKLRVIDVELVGSVPREQIVRRGVYWLAHHLARISPAGRWGEAVTVGDLAVVLGGSAGLPADGSWLDTAVREELAVQLEVQNGPMLGMTVQEWTQKFEDDLRADLSSKLVDMPLGDRLPARMHAVLTLIEVERAAAASTIDGLHAELAKTRGKLAATELRHDLLANSRSVRLANYYRRGVEWALPSGTRRRDLFHRVTAGRG